MVDLEPLVDAEDVELVRDLLARHVRYTQSPVAARLLGDWERSAGQVRQGDAAATTGACWPRSRRPQETGMSADEAVMASAHN